MSIPMTNVARAVETLLRTGARKSTVFVSERERVTAARRFKPRANEKTVDVVLTIGRPNAAQRKLVKRYLKAGKIPHHAHLAFYAKKQGRHG